jgi:hypothetical protein
VNKGRPIEFNRADAIVCWGYHVPPVANAVTLNASYDCVNQLFLNKSLNRIAANKAGMTVFEVTEMDMGVYRSELAKAKNANWTFKKAPASGYVMFEEFEGYGSRFYNFSRKGNVHLFNGEPIHSKMSSGLLNDLDVEYSKKLLRATGLDFGKVSFGVASPTYVGLKILTAPQLDKTLVDLYAKNIMNLIAIKQTQAAGLNHMKELMEL